MGYTNIGYATDEYIIGGGLVFIAPWDGVTPPDAGDFSPELAAGFTSDYGDFCDLGAVSAIAVSVENEVAEHYEIRSGVESLDKRVSTKVGETWKFTCDQINVNTLQMFFLGDASDTRHVTHLTNPTQEFALYVIPYYTSGDRWLHTAWRGQLKPTGDLALFSGKEYGKVDFEFTLLKDTTNHASSSWCDSTLPSSA